jgi:hypothetical protein
MTGKKYSLHRNGTEEFQQADENQNKPNSFSPFCKTVGRTQPSGNAQCLVMRCRPSNITQQQNFTECNRNFLECLRIIHYEFSPA